MLGVTERGTLFPKEGLVVTQKIRKKKNSSWSLRSSTLHSWALLSVYDALMFSSDIKTAFVQALLDPDKYQSHFAEVNMKEPCMPSIRLLSPSLTTTSCWKQLNTIVSTPFSFNWWDEILICDWLRSSILWSDLLGSLRSLKPSESLFWFKMLLTPIQQSSNSTSLLEKEHRAPCKACFLYGWKLSIVVLPL